MRLLAFAAAMIATASASADETKPIAVPYRLTPTQHVLVRVKLNGQGPFNFILDTGAPAMFVMKKVAEKVGYTDAGRGWSKFDRVEIEGGVVFAPARGRVEDLFQVEGMNGMGLAGVELHGVIGYNLLAHYRIEFDFTKDKLQWTKLNFTPPPIGGAGGRGSAGLEALGTMMKFLGALMGLKANFEVEPRGFLGAQFTESDGKLAVSSVLPEGPAAKAGLQPGDIIAKVGNNSTRSIDDLAKRLAKLAAGATLSLTISRDGREKQLDVVLGNGL